MEIAVNSIGGKLLLLKPTGKIGHWLDVRLSRFSPGAVVTVVSPSGKATAIAGGARGRQLPVLGGSAAPLRPRLRDARGKREGPLSVGRRERPAQRPRRPGRRHQGAASAGRARRGACLVPAPGLHGRRPAAARSRRSGTRRPSTRFGRAARASRSRRATSSTSPPRCGTPGRQARGTAPPTVTLRSAMPPTGCFSGTPPSTRT